MGSLSPSSDFRWSAEGMIRIKMSSCHLDFGCHGAPVSAGAAGLFQSDIPMRELCEVEDYKGIFPPKFSSDFHAAPSSFECLVEEIKN